MDRLHQLNADSIDRRGGLALKILAIATVSLAYAFLLKVFFEQQLERPQSQFFPFVILAFVGLFWVRWKEAPASQVAAPQRTPLLAVCLAAIAWLTLALAVAVYNPWLSLASFNLLLAAIGVIISRRRKVTYLWGLWAMLWVMLPLPLGLDQQLISKLQLISSKLSSYLLDVFGVDHLMSGNMLLLPDKKLFVDDACSGIVSVMSIVACGVIYGVSRNRPPLHIVGLATCGVFWAMLMNVVRITTIALVYDWYGIDWTTGAPHEILSLAVFLVTFGALLSTDLALVAMFAPIEKAWNAAAAKEIAFGGLLARWWDRLVQWGSPLRDAPAPDDSEPLSPQPPPRITRFAGGLSVTFGILAAGQIALLFWAYAHPPQGAAAVAEAQRMDRGSLPPSLAGVRQADFKAEKRERDDIFGEFSRTYAFRDKDEQPYTISCDFPFSQGWHELTVCYTGAGWEVAQRKTAEASGGDGAEPWTIVEAELTRSDGARGFVAWAMFDENGEPVSPPIGAVRDQLWRLFVRRSPLAPTRQMFQVQVFVQGAGPLGDEERATARKLLIESREQFRREIMGRKGQS